MPKVGPVELLWKGGSVCMTRGVGLKSTPKSNDGMSESSGNDYSVGGGMLDPGHGCEVGGGMLVLGDRYGVGGEGSRVGTTRGVTTGRREPYPIGAVLMLGLSVVVSLGVAASSFGALEI